MKLQIGRDKKMLGNIDRDIKETWKVVRHPRHPHQLRKI